VVIAKTADKILKNDRRFNPPQQHPHIKNQVLELEKQLHASCENWGIYHAKNAENLGLY